MKMTFYSSFFLEGGGGVEEMYVVLGRGMPGLQSKLLNCCISANGYLH